MDNTIRQAIQDAKDLRELMNFIRSWKDSTPMRYLRARWDAWNMLSVIQTENEAKSRTYQAEITRLNHVLQDKDLQLAKMTTEHDRAQTLYKDECSEHARTLQKLQASTHQPKIYKSKVFWNDLSRDKYRSLYLPNLE